MQRRILFRFHNAVEHLIVVLSLLKVRISCYGHFNGNYIRQYVIIEVLYKLQVKIIFMSV